jgi:hypothetical protein
MSANVFSQDAFCSAAFNPAFNKVSPSSIVILLCGMRSLVTSDYNVVVNTENVSDA